MSQIRKALHIPLVGMGHESPKTHRLTTQALFYWLITVLMLLLAAASIVIVAVELTFG